MAKKSGKRRGRARGAAAAGSGGNGSGKVAVKRGRRSKLAKTAAEAREVEALRIDGEGKRSYGVERVVDTVEQLYRRGAIGKREREAADLYQHAFDGCLGSIPNPLDRDRARGGSIAGSPTEAQCACARKLADAERVLGKIDGALVRMTVGEGLAVAAAARALFRGDGSAASARDREHAGRRLREALGCLADAWIPTGRGRMRASGVAGGQDGAAPKKMRETGPREIERQRGAHATRSGIYDI